MNKKEIIEAFNFRHACKRFDDTKKITKEDFDCILEAARLSPSSFGFEPWHFLIVQNSEKRASLMQEAFWGGQGQIPTCSHLVIALVKTPYFMHHSSKYIENFMRNVQHLPEDVIELRKKYFASFQEKDFDLSSSKRAMLDWATHQTYIAMANMMSVAAMLKIDSCPMEGFNKEKINETLAQDFGVDLEKYSIAYALAFGYRIDPQKVKTRQKIEEITTWFE